MNNVSDVLVSRNLLLLLLLLLIVRSVTWKISAELSMRLIVIFGGLDLLLLKLLLLLLLLEMKVVLILFSRGSCWSWHLTIWSHTHFLCVHLSYWFHPIAPRDYMCGPVQLNSREQILQSLILFIQKWHVIWRIVFRIRWVRWRDTPSGETWRLLVWRLRVWVLSNRHPVHQMMI